MSTQNPASEYGAFGSLVERIGIPRPLFWGFVAVFIFMIGDGVEISRLSGYLAGPGGLNGATASLTTGTIYGLAVLVASWFSSTLSAPMPSMGPTKDKGATLAILNFGAGAPPSSGCSSPAYSLPPSATGAWS